MKLAELAFACYIYGNMTDYDSSYLQFLENTLPQLDLNNENHCRALLNWLNDWGCRQFALEYHEQASKELRNWFQEMSNRLVPYEKTIIEMTDSDFTLVKVVYADLVNRTASERNLHGRNRSMIEFGPTGTAKILFALRPNSFIPWDIPMRSRFHFKGTAKDYVNYLIFVRKNLEEVAEICVRKGYKLVDLPTILGRPKSSLTKLVDEYFWVTVSRNCPAPSHQDLNQWALWW